MTAVEWLLEALKDKGALNYYPKAIIKQAKELEKQQIIDANRDGVDMAIMNEFITGEDYYTKTYQK